MLKAVVTEEQMNIWVGQFESCRRHIMSKMSQYQGEENPTFLKLWKKDFIQLMGDLNHVNDPRFYKTAWKVIMIDAKRVRFQSPPTNLVDFMKSTELEKKERME